MKTYAERLTYAMDVRGTTQSILARAVGVKPQSIQYLCTQGNNSVHTVKIARALQISPDWLEDGTGDMELINPELLRNLKRLPGKDIETIRLFVKTLIELIPFNNEKNVEKEKESNNI